MTTILKKIGYNGYLLVPYDLIRMLGITDACVLARLIAEENYVSSEYSNRRLTTFVNNFLISKDSLCNYLHLTMNQLIKSLRKLLKLGFIIFDENGSDYISVYLAKDVIINKVQNASRKNNYPVWNADFKRIYDINSHRNCFIDSTNKLIDYCEDEGITFMTQTYHKIDVLIRGYIKQNNIPFFITHESKIKDFIKEQEAKNNFEDYKLWKFIHDICYPPEQTT